MTWLDIGNGYRNLYLLSVITQAFTFGMLFAHMRWFSKKNRLACFFTGVACTPFIQYLFMLVLAFVWPNAPRLVIIATLPVLAICTLGVLVFLHRKEAKVTLYKSLHFIQKLHYLDKTTLISICVAFAMLILLLPSCVRFMSSMYTVSGGDSGEYMALGLRYAENRQIEDLLAKEDPTGHFRGHSHFPSLELYMSYGLMHTSDTLGYPYDKPAFTSLGLLIFYLLSAYLALLLHFTNKKPAYVALGLLLVNLVPNLYHAVAGAPRDIWRILALFLAMLALTDCTEKGNIWQYLRKIVFFFVLCFTVMSAHVVCFVVLPFIVLAWGVYRLALGCITPTARRGTTLLRTVGLCVSGALGTLLAFSGNLYCYVKWGQMNPWRLMTTYTDAPWYPLYMQMEYRLEETTTHLNFFQSASDIFMNYATPIGTWGFILACVGLLLFILYASRKKASFYPSSLLLLCLYTLFTLAPMSGLLDSPLYSFSGAFLKLHRYTLQWFMLTGIMIPALLANLPPLLQPYQFPSFYRKIPLYVCTLLCVCSFVTGTKQTGYANYFYRQSRSTMENQSLLLDTSFIDRYGLLRHVAMQTNGNVLIPRSGYQYALQSRGLLLGSNAIVPIMNLPKEEIASALSAQNIVMVATEPDFWDERYYALSGLADYLRTLPTTQIIQTPSMRLYLLDDSLVSIAHAYLEGE